MTRPPDDLGIDEIRERVLAGWAAAPVRFREDANTEEDFALGGYRDRVLVELAQNAADAATRAGVPGRLLFAVRDGVLLAANTGAPLDAAGVQALATLRASAKRHEHEAVGRFGVGFSAVLAVSDAPEVISRGAAVGFSRDRTRALAEQMPSLAEELAGRGGHVPVLRLPFPVEAATAAQAVPDGYDTVVRLPIRDAAAHALLTGLLAELDDAMLLALPALAEIRIETATGERVLTDAEQRWITLRRNGFYDPAVLTDRPVEERARTAWSLAWAVPRTPGPLPVTAVLHAPTPTDEPLPWPAVLVAAYPLDPSRRHVASGPAADELTRRAAEAYAELAERAVGAGTGWQAWDLLPSGFPAGPLDGALRELVPPALATAAVLVSAETGDPVRPRDAVFVEGAVGADLPAVQALSPSVAGLLHAPPAGAASLRALGVRSVSLADLVEQLPGGRSPAEWRELYAALAGPAVDPLVREGLAQLPVPLADGRLVHGVRGTVALEPAGGGAGEAGAALSALGVRVVDPEAVHPLLVRCGARELSLGAALGLDEVLAAIEQSLDAAEDGDDGPSEAVLQLVASALAAAGDPGATAVPPGWPTTLALRDADGEIAPAGELVLPGSTAARLLDPQVLPPVASDLLDRWGPDVLRAVGVRDTLVVQQFGDLDLTSIEPAESPELPEFEEWIDGVLHRPGSTGARDVTLAAHEFRAIADLDAVPSHAWPEVLAVVAADPDLRAAVVDPVRIGVRPADGPERLAVVPPWTAWWLRRELAAGLAWADPQAVPIVTRLVDPPPPVLAELDPPLRRALGAVVALEDLDPAALAHGLDADADLAALLGLWAALGRAAAAGAPGAAEITPPQRFRAVRGARLVEAEADDVTVVDHPAWLQRTDLGAAVVAPPSVAEALADLLELPLAADLADGVVDETGSARSEVPDAVRRVLPQAPATWCEHEELFVDGVPVSWWVEDEEQEAPTIHACTVEGLARGLAWTAGAWHLRGAVLAVLDGLTAADEVLLDEAFAR